MQDNSICKVIKNGNIYKVTVPKCLVRALDLENSCVKFKIINNNIVMRKVK